MVRLLNDAGNAAIWVSSIGIVIWVVQYSLLAKWWGNAIGITLIGEAVAILAIYLPTLLALADPADYAHFATTRWYLYLTVGIVVATALFILTRIVTWELIRRNRGESELSPAVMAIRIRDLEAELAEFRERHGLA